MKTTITLQTPNPDWVEKPSLTIEELEEFQANCVAYAQNNSGNYSAPSIDAHIVVLLMKMLTEMRELKSVLVDIKYPSPKSDIELDLRPKEDTYKKVLERAVEQFGNDVMKKEESGIHKNKKG